MPHVSVIRIPPRKFNLNSIHIHLIQLQLRDNTDTHLRLFLLLSIQIDIDVIRKVLFNASNRRPLEWKSYSDMCGSL